MDAPVLKRAAVVVRALVGQRTQEVGQQVAVGCMDFDDVKAGLDSTLYSSLPSCLESLDILRGHSLRRSITIGERYRARGPDVLPTMACTSYVSIRSSCYQRHNRCESLSSRDSGTKAPLLPSSQGAYVPDHPTQLFQTFRHLRIRHEKSS